MLTQRDIFAVCFKLQLEKLIVYPNYLTFLTVILCKHLAKNP